ncbi:glycosyltransferase [Geodermatophilus arenarius]
MEVTVQSQRVAGHHGGTIGAGRLPEGAVPVPDRPATFVRSSAALYLKSRTKEGHDMPSLRSILVVIDTLDDNGSLRWVHRLSSLWLKAGCGVDYLSFKYGVDGRRLMPPAGATLTYGDSRVRRFRKALPGALLRSLRVVAAADVVLVISEVGMSVPLAYGMTRVTRRPFVVYVQSIADYSHALYLPRWLQPIWRFCIRHADAVLCVSTGSAEAAKRIGVSPAKITIATTGIDVDAVRRSALPEAGAQAPRTTQQSLVACGELQPHKGYDILIRALARVHETGRRVGLVLIGRGPEETALRRLADDLGVADAVTFTGHMRNPLPEISRGAAFVHPARVEAVGTVLLEAIALGVPTIAADCEAGGPGMVLGGGRYGQLVEPESVQALAEAICAHLDDPAQLARRAGQAEPHLRESFSADRTAATILEVFCRAAGASRRVRRGHGVLRSASRLIPRSVGRFRPRTGRPDLIPDRCDETGGR